MKFAVVLIATIASVQAGINRAGWSPSTEPPTTPGWSTTTQAPTTTGWSSTAPPTTAGWSSTAPPTTAGWSTAPPTTAGWSSTAPPTTAGWSTAPPTTAGWSTAPPTTSGWSTPGWSAPTGWASPSNVAITLDAGVGAAGAGWAAEDHAENVQVVGGGWSPAALSISAGGDSLLDQSGQISQVTNIDAENASSLNLASITNIAEASEAANVAATGLEIAFGQSGWAGAAGEGALASASNTLLNANSSS